MGLGLLVSSFWQRVVKLVAFSMRKRLKRRKQTERLWTFVNRPSNDNPQLMMKPIDADVQHYGVVKSIEHGLINGEPVLHVVTEQDEFFVAATGLTCWDQHAPVYHRDNKEPWCDRCGLTEYFLLPTLKETDNG